MQWQGIRRDTGITGDGAYSATGTDMRIEGELHRRNGMELSVEQSGTAFIAMWSPIAGRFAVFSTSTGDVITEAV